VESLSPHCGPDGHCITCGDDAKPMRIVHVDAGLGLALCEDEAGARRTVEIGLVDPVDAGDRVLVHADVALSTLSEQFPAEHGGAKAEVGYDEPFPAEQGGAMSEVGYS